MNVSQKPVMWTMVICSIILAILGIFAYNGIVNAIPEKQDIDVPTSEEIAGQVLANVNIPTAEDIASQIDVPEVDTFVSVHDYKNDLAFDLSEDELSDRDVKEEIANSVNDCDDTDMDRHDITRISVRDDEVSGYGDYREVELEVKVYFDNFGDEEEPEDARVIVTFEVEDLDRDDDYEDAEANLVAVGNPFSCSTD